MFLIKREGCIPYLPSYDTADINSEGMTTVLMFWYVVVFFFFSISFISLARIYMKGCWSPKANSTIK